MINVILLLLSISLLWYLYFFAYKDYVVDCTRHELFILRDELFDYANSGQISFDNETYKTTRRMINGVLRFTHDISLSNWAMISFFANEDSRNYQKQFANNFERNMKKLNSQQQTMIKETLYKTHFLIVKHLLKTSLLLVIPLFILIFLKDCINSLTKNYKSWMLIDAQADLIGKNYAF
jgi:hypothetical protein